MESDIQSESELKKLCDRVSLYWPANVRDRSLDLITTFLRDQQTVLDELNKIGVSEEEFSLVYSLVAKNVKTLKINIKVVSQTLKRLNSIRDQIKILKFTVIEPPTISEVQCPIIISPQQINEPV